VNFNNLRVKFYKATTIDSSDNNGGAISSSLYSTDQEEGIFSHILAAASIDSYRKVFIKTDVGSAQDVWCFIGNQSWEPGVYYTCLAGSATDIQSYAATLTNWKGIGYLVTAITSANTDKVVASFEAVGVYEGNSIAIIDWNTLDNYRNPQCYYTLANTVEWSGTKATITTDNTIFRSFSTKTKATLTTYNTETYSGLNNTVLRIALDNNIISIPFGDATTATDVSSTINYLGSNYLSSSASIGNVIIQHNKYGSEHFVQVLKSSANNMLNFDNEVHRGTDGTIVSAMTNIGTLAVSAVIWIKETVTANSSPCNNWFSFMVVGREV